MEQLLKRVCRLCWVVICAALIGSVGQGFLTNVWGESYHKSRVKCLQYKDLRFILVSKVVTMRRFFLYEGGEWINGIHWFDHLKVN